MDGLVNEWKHRLIDGALEMNSSDFEELSAVFASKDMKCNCGSHVVALMCVCADRDCVASVLLLSLCLTASPQRAMVRHMMGQEFMFIRP